jgi:hypothetical protein
MALTGEAKNAFQNGFARILPSTLQISGVVVLHIRDLEVAR